MTISSNGKAMTFLSDDFVPSPRDIIIGRGKKISNQIGNLRLRSIVQSRLEGYSDANSDKTHKTYIISQILHEIATVVLSRRTRRQLLGTTSRTLLPGLTLPRSLHDSYRSSKLSKQCRRWAKSGTQAATITRMCASEMLPKIDAPQNCISKDFLLSISYFNFDQEEKPQKRQSERVTAAGRLKGIMDEALVVFNTEELLWTPPPPEPFFTDEKTFDLLAASFFPVDETGLVGNPFEPTPLLVNVKSA